MSKYTVAERQLVRNIISNLTIKRIPESEIIKEVFNQTGKTLSRSGLFRIKQSIRRDSFKWYTTLKQGQHEYIHEFKERVDEILDLQRWHYKIIDDNANNPTIQQTSLAALHKLSITLSNLYDVLPFISNTVGGTGQVSTVTGTRRRGVLFNDNVNSNANNNNELKLIPGINCHCAPKDIVCHYKCRYCLQAWRPEDKDQIQDICPNPNCEHSIKGCHFQPWDELNKWIQCTTCHRWFETDKILAIHSCSPSSAFNEKVNV